MPLLRWSETARKLTKSQFTALFENEAGLSTNQNAGLDRMKLTFKAHVDWVDLWAV